MGTQIHKKVPKGTQVPYRGPNWAQWIPRTVVQEMPGLFTGQTFLEADSLGSLPRFFEGAFFLPILAGLCF